MASLSDHPTVQAIRNKQATEPTPPPATPLDATWLRNLCLEAGVDDVGFVHIDRPELDDQRADILAVFPHAKTLISMVGRMNRENVRSPARSLANNEFHHTDKALEDQARSIVATLERRGIRAINPAVGFPMEIQHFPGKTWIISHKPVAIAAGLGQMGIHRNIIHPRFGNFILLMTIVIDAEVTSYTSPINYNPCLECKLCVAACPVGAIGADGHFNFTACFTHNYREFMGGFTDWVEQIADSKDKADYHDRVTPSETASMWQSLSFGANYKAAYCMAVCPAGEDVIGPFLANRKTYLNEVVKPLQNKKESVYVVAGSDAEAYVSRRFPHKTIRRIGSGLTIQSIQSFLGGLSLAFQREQAGDLRATYHFTFTGREAQTATITIEEKKLKVLPGHVGKADVAIKVDSSTWINMLNGRIQTIWAVLTGKLKVKGNIRLLQAFQRCFPR